MGQIPLFASEASDTWGHLRKKSAARIPTKNVKESAIPLSLIFCKAGRPAPPLHADQTIDLCDVDTQKSTRSPVRIRGCVPNDCT